MAVTNRAAIAQQLEPGLNAVLGDNYNLYPEEWRDIYTVETSERAFEEEVMMAGMAGAVTKGEGANVSFDSIGETWIARYNHETIALAGASGSAFAQTSTTGPVVEEVIVTAQKRSERLQSVPVSITAIEAKTLDDLAIDNARDFVQFAPSLNFQAADEARLFNFSIRGIGTESFSVGVEPSVSTIVDGVVYTRVGSVFDGIGDLERVGRVAIRRRVADGEGRG